MIAKWVWLKDETESVDFYVDFKQTFDCKKYKNVTLNVSCDSSFSAFVNGKIAGFSYCADFPNYKLYDSYDVTKLIKKNNEITFTVWHFGADSQTYINSTAGLWFEILGDGEVIAVSGSDTLCRKNNRYKNGYCKNITTQLGFSFYYDARALEEQFGSCEIIEKSVPTKRMQKPLRLNKRLKCKYSISENVITVDLGSEIAGYVDFDFISEGEQLLTVSWGEHLVDGKVLRKINGRDFSFEYYAVSGKNVFKNFLRRLAGRYLQIEFSAPIKIKYLGLLPVEYPIKTIPRKFSPRRQKIYDVAVNTLKMCMHEHYEDCPWREQALYALDSRNQMLYGYYAFSTTEYPRSNLVLLSKGLRSDGLLSINSPGGIDIPIPFFSLAYVLAISEYITYTGDRTILSEVGHVLTSIIETFNSKVGKNGLIPTFKHPYWNFYEWTEGNDRAGEISRAPTDAYTIDYDLTMNAFYVFVVNKYNEVVGGNYDTQSIKTAIHENLYNESEGLYKNSVGDERFSQLGNSISALIGLKVSIEKLRACENMTKASISMSPFLYDALLCADQANCDFVLQDIDTRCGAMVDSGSTTLWETDLGWRDFNNAGSLCHGWSALPVYYYNVLKAK